VDRVIASGDDDPADAADSERFETLSQALKERLDEMLDRPLGELVAMVRQDLGVAFDPGLWAEADWMEPVRAVLSARRAEREARPPWPPGVRARAAAPLRPG
jgi:hypothetical protein